MKNKTSLRILAFALLLLQLLLLCACTGGTGGADTSGADTSSGTPTDTASDTTTAPESTVPAGISLIGEDGKARFKVIRPEDCGSALTGAASAFRTALSKTCGAELQIATDWVKKEEDIDNEAFEILIGKTNRTASSEAAAGLSMKDYVITVSGNKIVICGGSELSTITALDRFSAECVSGSAVMLAEAIRHNQQYTAKDFTIAGIPASQFTIVYPTAAAAEDGRDIADALNDMLSEAAGFTLDVRNDSKAETANEIVIGKTGRAESVSLYNTDYDTFDYKVSLKDGKLYFAGGSCFALRYCIEYIKDTYLAGGRSLDEGLTSSGSMYGQYIFGREQGAELRIMCNNVWSCDANQPVWAALGENCSAQVRSKGLAAVYMAYLPDIICFQEMSTLMISLIQREIKGCGYSYALLSFSGSDGADNTCILYRTDTLSIKDKGHHDYAYGNNGGSKSYTWGLFEMKETGKTFVALSTHLWWMSESAQAGSDNMRERQAAEIVAQVDTLINKYNCPVYAMGDLNTRTTSAAFKVLLNGGLLNTYSLASIFADNHRGRHSCGPDGFAREDSAGTYANDAIDHILIKNGGAAKILTFNHARPYFYIKLSDHYPVYVDVIPG